MTRSIHPILLAGLALLLGCGGPGGTGRLPVRTKTIELGPFHIDRIFHSMEGPSQRTRFDTGDIEWVTGYSTQVVDLNSGQPMGDEFFCHSQLQLDNQTRLLVNATGIDEIRFPDGYGLPLAQVLAGVPESGRGLSVLGMVLNNHEADIDRLAKIRVTLEYLSADDLGAAPGLKKLYKVGLPVTVPPAEGEMGDGHHHPEGARPVDHHPAHWVVPPGRQVQRRKYTGVLPVDATVHFGVVHLHNYGVYMRLTDLTEGRILWQTDVVNEPGRVQIDEIPVYSSTVGFPMFKDHEYEVEALYDNTSGRPVDAMASMYLFYHPVGDESITYPESPPGPESG